MSNIYDAVWLNINATRARKLLRGRGVRIDHNDFTGGRGHNTRGFVIKPKHYKRLEKVIKKKNVYTLRLDEDEIEVNAHHRYHKIKIGEGFFDSLKNFASSAWNTVKDVGKKVYNVAQKVAKSPLGQAALKGIDLLAATEGVPPGLISGVTNQLLGVNNEPEEEQPAEEDYDESEYVHPSTGQTYYFPQPTVQPRAKVPKGGGAIYSNATYSARKAGFVGGSATLEDAGRELRHRHHHEHRGGAVMHHHREEHRHHGGALKMTKNGRYLYRGRFISNAQAQQIQGGSLYLTR